MTHSSALDTAVGGPDRTKSQGNQFPHPHNLAFIGLVKREPLSITLFLCQESSDFCFGGFSTDAEKGAHLQVALHSVSGF